MSSEVATIGALILGSMIAGWILGAAILWAAAEIDERKWRRRAVDILSQRREHE